MTRTPPPRSDLAAPVEVSDGAVALGGRPVLRGVDVRVERGELVAILGPNGSGKSTLVKAMTGLLPVTQGEVRLFGTPLLRFSDWQRIGYVPQRAGAGSGVPASVWEVVASGRLTRRRLLRPLSRSDRRSIHDALEVVGLGERRRDGVSQLSGGQQQRVLIARALAGEPELFFLDEPTAGVDAANQRALADALGVLKGRGSTLVLVAHELGPLRPLVDRAVVLRDGRVVHDGAPPYDHDPLHHDQVTHDHHPHDEVDPVTGRRPRDHAPHVASPLEDHFRGQA